MWFLDHLRIVPVAYYPLAALAVLALIQWGDRLAPVLGRLLHPRRRAAAVAAGVAVVLACTLVFYRFRSTNYELGDALVFWYFATPLIYQYGFHTEFDELLEGFLQSKAFLFVDQTLDWPLGPWGVYAWKSALCGGLFILALIHLREPRPGRDASILIILVSAGMQLFFGYVENYVVTTLWIALFTLLGVRWIQADRITPRTLVALGLLAAVAVSFHLVAAYLLFALVYLAYLSAAHAAAGRRVRAFLAHSSLATVVCLVYLGALVAYFSLVPARRLSILNTHAAHLAFYRDGFFTWKHWRGVLNVFLLTSTPGAIVLLYVVPGRVRAFARDRSAVFLALVTGGFLLHACVWYPMIGFYRDWDLFSFYWFPLHYLAYYLYNRSARPGKRYALMVACVVGVVVSFSWIVSNTWDYSTWKPPGPEMAAFAPRLWQESH